MSGVSLIRSFHRVFVGNLPWTVAGKDLKMYFSKFGHVSSASVVFDKTTTGLSKGYGFVEFSTHDGFIAATNNQVHFLEGRVISVQKARNID
uniref:Putative rna recognition motif found in sra stem-loop-interacting rna-binding protein n=1 Tax=Nyssomyia neivai TaxID=330878 RepID=A0A1L8DI41_9DIPT